MARVVQAALLAIGDELLAGRTREAHLAWLAPRLSRFGVDLVEARTIGDDEASIQGTIWELQERRGADLVVATGGLGPTHDDRTLPALARLHGASLIEDPATWNRIQARYEKRSATAGSSARRMALVPAGAQVWCNDVGAAPGLALRRPLRYRAGTAWTFVFPGVPDELHALWSAYAEPFIAMLVGTARRVRHEIELECHAREADIAHLLATVQRAHCAVRIGSYPRHGDSRIMIHLSGFEAQAVEAATAAAQAALRGLGVPSARTNEKTS